MQAEDAELSNYALDTVTIERKRAQYIKSKMENSQIAKIMLFLVTILGTSMVIGDGILTPCISVLSAVSGIKSLGQDAVTWISVVILIFLFVVQKFGTDKVGASFAPIIFIWFTFIAAIGLYDLIKYDITVLRAFNPFYIITYFIRNGKQAWISLGGVIMCITGTEAMFADLGHFNVRAIQISFSGIVFPALLAAYSGQASYLTKHPENVENTFYDSIPGPLYWPTFVVAVLAAIIASQAMISGGFSIIAQSLSLGCFPRVKVVHTSPKHEGQVYIPEINYLLMIACVLVTVSFKTTEHIGNAYGIAVVAVMVITTCLVSLIMLTEWKTKLRWVAGFFGVFFVVESIYLSSVLYKFAQGGYLPLAFSVFLMTIMGIWHYVHKQRYVYELNNKLPADYVKELVVNSNVNRVPGMGLLYSELVQGIPPIFPHFVANIPSIHSVLVFVSIKSIPISKVLLEERFLFRRVEPRDLNMYRCVVRYGYRDQIEEAEEFQRQLVENLKEFIRNELLINGAPTAEQMADPAPEILAGAEEEMQFVQRARENGVVYLLGEADVVAEPNSSLFKKILVNYVYNFLRKNFRQGEKFLAIPQSKLLRVGMTYEI
ncbi:Potassium transporter [Melia azedarach]|uniref:Potassium transporter n=1 Tax=Melia azedarach TaxID=155640 RepID=A0ACC1YAN5_MELAZ|nr:Potassium transporter [Melia azedarach]